MLMGQLTYAVPFTNTLLCTIQVWLLHRNYKYFKPIDLVIRVVKQI